MPTAQERHDDYNMITYLAFRSTSLKVSVQVEHVM